MRRIGSDPHRPCVRLGRPAARDERRPVLCKSWIPLQQQLRQLVVTLEFPERRWVAKLVQPFAVSARRILDVAARQAEAFQADHAAHALGPDARIQQRDVAAHAVADQPGRPGGTERVEQEIEVREVIGEPVVGTAPRAPAEAPPVERDERPVALERVDEELEGVGRVGPAMEQDDRIVRLGAPTGHMVRQAAHRPCLVPRQAAHPVGHVFSPPGAGDRCVALRARAARCRRVYGAPWPSGSRVSGFAKRCVAPRSASLHADSGLRGCLSRTVRPTLAAEPSLHARADRCRAKTRPAGCGRGLPPFAPKADSRFRGNPALAAGLSGARLREAVPGTSLDAELSEERRACGAKHRRRGHRYAVPDTGRKTRSCSRKAYRSVMPAT